VDAGQGAMPEVAQALGIATSLAWRRSRRRQPVSDGREALPLASRSSGPGRWQAVLIDALSKQPAITVNYAVTRHLSREPTHAELVRRGLVRSGPCSRRHHRECSKLFRPDRPPTLVVPVRLPAQA
jgi:hypothetical protein